MACLVPPPIVVEATVTISAGATQSFHAEGASAAFINSHGDLNFACFHHGIVVSFTIETPGMFFQGKGNESVNFAESPRGPLRKLLPKHQFPMGVLHRGQQQIWFAYSNHRDCGVGDDHIRCPTSKYSLNIGPTPYRVRHVDPVIQNGGSNY